ncbi:MAG: YggW family oxidoreductase, partial [Salinisphaeraceae bacterium]|nr:YggW family oxidoreductase [Salinisphaeraceae bacterium]
MSATTPLSLYVHIPWCVRKCPYCDFNSHPVEGGMDEAAYVDALLADLAFEAPLANGRP